LKIKFIRPSYEIDLCGLTGIQMLKNIEKRARTCYKTEDKITDDSYIKLIKHLIKLDHGAMLEFASFNIKFVVNRAFTHEIVRHRIASFAQESQRYVGYGDAIEFIIPSWMDHDAVEFDAEDSTFICKLWDDWSQADIWWMGSMIDVAIKYRCLLDEGWKPEQARDILPNACKTEINVYTNLRECIHIFKLREHHTASPQMRELMAPAHQELRELIPLVFDFEV
jgi:thymidylate synthase (FAD)